MLPLTGSRFRVLLCKAKVLRVEKLAIDCFSLLLEEKNLATGSLPGHFLHIRVGEGPAPFLRRPFSIAGTSPGEGFLQIIFRLRGAGTRILSRACPGDMLDCLGPLGNGFRPRENCKISVLLGGGMGVAPLLFLARRLKEVRERVVLYYGVSRGLEKIPVQNFLPPGVEINLATEDGSGGFAGLVTDLHRSHLQRGLRPEEVFACGPRPMMQRVAGMYRDKKVDMQFSFEERMACGVGACHGCPIEIKVGDSDTVFKRVCRDGPVFNPYEVVW